MSKICNPRPSALSERLAHPFHCLLDCVTPTIQYVRIHVALQRDLVADETARLDGIDAPVKSECIVAALLGKAGQGVIGALGEKGEGNEGSAFFGKTAADFGGDVLQGWKGKFGEVMRGEFSCPRVEDLQKLHWRGEGIVISVNEGNQLNIVKDVGRVEQLSKTYLSTSFNLSD